MKRAAEQFKFEFERYVGALQAECIEANSCDYKQTFQDELDEIKKRAERGFARACVLLDSLSDVEQGKLRRYAEYRLRTPYLDYKFCEFDLVNKDPEVKNGLGEMRKTARYVGPLWLSVYGDFMKARELTA